jgi:hypothetical protein
LPSTAAHAPRAAHGGTASAAALAAEQSASSPGRSGDTVPFALSVRNSNRVALTPSGGSRLALIAATCLDRLGVRAGEPDSRAYKIRSFRWVYRPYPAATRCCGVLVHSDLLRLGTWSAKGA